MLANPALPVQFCAARRKSGERAAGFVNAIVRKLLPSLARLGGEDGDTAGPDTAGPDTAGPDTAGAEPEALATLAPVVRSAVARTPPRK